MSSVITFTKISNDTFSTDSLVRGNVSKKYIDKNYNLGGEAAGSFSYLPKSYLSNNAIFNKGWS